jgi:hypothetical protein
MQIGDVERGVVVDHHAVCRSDATITTKHTGWPVFYGHAPRSPAARGVIDGMAVAWLGTVILRWAMSRRRWRSWLHWDHNSGPAFAHTGLWRTTCAAAKARVGHPWVQLRQRCGRTAPCRGAIGILPFRGLLRWRGKRSASPWTEFVYGVASHKRIHSGARRGTSTNGRSTSIGGIKILRGSPFAGETSSSDGRSIPMARLMNLKKQRTSLALTGTNC